MDELDVELLPLGWPRSRVRCIFEAIIIESTFVVENFGAFLDRIDCCAISKHAATQETTAAIIETNRNLLLVAEHRRKK